MDMYGASDYINGQAAAADLFGMSPANQTRAAGQSTPLVSATGRDRQFLPWHPDSPGFWLGLVAIGTLVGIIGADARVRFGKRRAEASIGTT